MTAYSIRKSNWFDLSNDFEYFTSQMNQKFLEFYSMHLLNPLKTVKKKEVAIFDLRSDYKQYIVLEEIPYADIYEIRQDLFKRMLFP